ncbi:MAG: hypothetical protein IPI64_00020 [Chloracidobacterium sp.]|nr:hypothetical protein [Chloracidobacterium sp.]
MLSHLEGKNGLLRKYLLGKRQDFSARAVIVPDPLLRIDQCGIPFEMLLSWLKPLILNRLVQEKGLSKVDARNVIERALRGDPYAFETVKECLEHTVADQNLLVLINRQPSLHRYSLLAFKPQIRMDHVVGIPPMVCNGFNADFDGDTVAVYLPVTQKSQKEAQKMLSTNHLFSGANGKLNLSLGQDYALGSYLKANTLVTQKGMGKEFLENKHLPDRLGSLLGTIDDVGDQVKSLKLFQDDALTAATTGIASFSFF